MTRYKMEADSARSNKERDRFNNFYSNKISALLFCLYLLRQSADLRIYSCGYNREIRLLVVGCVMVDEGTTQGLRNQLFGDYKFVLLNSISLFLRKKRFRFLLE